jgi:putative NAD(P)-binding protein
MIVITTPTGQIGRQVLGNLLDSGEQLRVIARDPSQLPAEVRDDIVEGSHGDAAVVDKAFAGADAVFWLRLCLRGGFRCFNRIARVMGFDIPEEPGPDAGTTLTYAEFLDAVGRMREVGFPIERDPAEAWPDFVGWRVNYEPAAYAVAAAVYAVPALWSGPRRHKISPIAPIRPGRGDPSS